jgi:hypothetical protein
VKKRGSTVYQYIELFPENQNVALKSNHLAICLGEDECDSHIMDRLMAITLRQQYRN